MTLDVGAVLILLFMGAGLIWGVYNWAHTHSHLKR
jgi:hypothetical protein